MEAKELRLCNLIDRGGDIREVTSNMLSQPSIIFQRDFKPIPLTEEWLVKFGFEKHKKSEKERLCYHYKIKTNKIFEAWIVDNGFGESEIRLWNRKDDWSQKYDEICSLPKYVHQLQNLYFALTGEELTIK